MAKNPHQKQYKIFHYWLLLVGLIGFTCFVLIDLGILPEILRVDVTRICTIIFIVFVLTSLNCGYRSWYISAQIESLRAIQSDDGQLIHHPPSKNTTRSLALNYLHSIAKTSQDQDISQLGEILAEAIRGSHKIGWFIVGVLIKLGLLGTVIGFVMMLSTVSNLENLDISGVKQLMQQMTQGMGIAMYTTMFGLVCSILLGIQYLLLDRSADKFVAQTISLGQSYFSDLNKSPSNLKQVN